MRVNTGNPKAGVKVQLISGTKTVVGTATSDADGVWQILYKHTGKAATYSVKHEGTGMTKSVELKANGWAEANFELAPVTVTAGGGGQ